MYFFICILNIFGNHKEQLILLGMIITCFISLKIISNSCCSLLPYILNASSQQNLNFLVVSFILFIINPYFHDHSFYGIGFMLPSHFWCPLHRGFYVPTTIYIVFLYYRFTLLTIVFIFLTPHATSIHKKDVNNRSLFCLPKEFQEAFCPPCSECGM